MSSEKNRNEKTRLHPRNRNKEKYDLKALTIVHPELKNHISLNKYGSDSIDFSNPVAVKALNKALLNHYYGIKNWDFPNENLCPPIPGRADYIHYIADLLAENNTEIPKNNKITCLDIGVGANCIYPIIGITEYSWKFIATDINRRSIKSVKKIVNANPSLKNKIECKLQENPKKFFTGIINKKDKIDVSICNPPFHSSSDIAKKGTKRKVENLSGKKVKTPKLNFAGISNELVCDGGEYGFITNMIKESKEFSKNVYWFSSLVSKQSNLKGIYTFLEKTEATQIKTINIETGNKTSRIVVWTFLSEKEQKEWREIRWK